MSLTVAPSVSRGTAPLLQPSYYTSSLFVEPMREDISNLLSAFAAAFAEDPLELERPFQLFKNIWRSQGWDIVHLKALDARARETFLRTVTRLFIERLDPVEHALIRLGSLFGLYIFYMIQPDSLTAGIYVQENITLSTNTYEQLLAFPGTLQRSLRSYATYIISQFLSLQVFHIIPHSDLGSQNPRILPHTAPLLTRDIDHGHKKKVGRPSHLAQSQRADSALLALEHFVDQVGVHDDRAASGSAASSSPLPERPIPDNYVTLKERLRDAVPHDVVKTAETLTMERMRDAERHAMEHKLPVGDREGIERLNKASSQAEGLLGLVNNKVRADEK